MPLPASWKDCCATGPEPSQPVAADCFLISPDHPPCMLPDSDLECQPVGKVKMQLRNNPRKRGFSWLPVCLPAAWSDLRTGISAKFS